jgi:hypothetical protein
MHISTNRLLAPLLGLLITSSPLAGQSEKECQSPTKLHAWLTNNAGGPPGAAMIADPQTCEIAVPDGGSYRTVDPAADCPAGGFEQANWDSRYEHEKFHQANCRRLNGSGSNYQQGLTNPETSINDGKSRLGSRTAICQDKEFLHD